MTWSSTGRAVLAVVCVFAMACATSGRPFNADAIPKIERGKWRQADVQRQFGQPQGVSVRGSGYQVWRYRSEERSSTDTGTLTRIGAFIARILGRNVITSPVNVRTSNVTYYQLDVEFDAQGVVTDYQYTRETQPSREVY